MRLIGPPPEPPLTVADLKAHARLDHAHEDATLERMLSAAVASVETAAHRPLSPRAVIFTVRRPFMEWWFPVAPVRSLTAVRVSGGDGEAEPVEGLRLVQAHDEPRLAASAVVWPSLTGGRVIEIEAEIGYDADAPEAAPLHQAALMLAAWRVRQRESASAEGARAVPFGLQSDIRQHRYIRPCEMRA